MSPVRVTAAFAIGAALWLASPALSAEDVLFTGALLSRAVENSMTGAGPDVIGWSKKGRMAYVNYVASPAPGGAANVYVEVIDLVTDAILFRRLCGRTAERPSVDAAAVNNAAAQLNRLGIFHAPTARQRFPVFLEDDVVSLTIAEEAIDPPAPEEGGMTSGNVAIAKTTITFTCKKERANATKRFASILVGPYVLQDEEGAVSYYMSPYETRIAIFFSMGTFRADNAAIVRGDNGFIGCNLKVGFE